MKPKTPSNTDFDNTGGEKKPLVSAKAKAVSLLARREHSQVELRSKLLLRGYTADEIEEALAWAESHKFQSNDRFKASLVKRRSATLGDRAISAELAQHGLGAVKSSAHNPDASVELETEENRAYDWINRKHFSALHLLFEGESPPDAHLLMSIKSRVFRGLSQRGFEFGNIDRAWRRVLSELKSNA